MRKKIRRILAMVLAAIMLAALGAPALSEAEFVQSPGDGTLLPQALTIPGGVVWSIIPGDGTLTVNWEPPVDDGGSPITGYRIALDRGTYNTVDANIFSYTYSSLNNGQEYWVSIQAVNGEGASLAQSKPATPGKAPSAPQDLYTERIDAGIVLNWEYPADMGTGDFSGFLVSMDGGATWNDADRDYRHTFKGLTGGQFYDFAVRGKNGYGEGEIASLTEMAISSPSAPQNFTAEAGDGIITCRWELPLDLGGGTVDEYYLWAENDGVSVVSTPVRANGQTSLEMTIGGLENGVTYDCYVNASNEVGSGAAAHTSATPKAKLRAPRNLAVKPGDRQATVTWDAPEGFEDDDSLTYEVSLDGDEWVSAGGKREYTFRNLNNGEEYTFYVRALRAEDEEVSEPASEVGTPVAPDIDDGDDDDDDDDDIPQTGDDGGRLTAWLWVMASAMALMLAASVALWFVRRRARG